MSGPRVEAVQAVLRREGDSLAARYAGSILDAADAADRAAGIVRVDTQDEALERRLAETIHQLWHPNPDCGFWPQDRDVARLVLAALAGRATEQEAPPLFVEDYRAPEFGAARHPTPPGG